MFKQRLYLRVVQIRKGSECPVLPNLCILVGELLALSIKNDKNIQGIQLGNETLYISQLTS